MNREKMDAAKAYLKEEYAKVESGEIDIDQSTVSATTMRDTFQLSLAEFDAVMHELVKERSGYEGVKRYDGMRRMLAFVELKDAMESATSLVAKSDVCYEDMEKFTIWQVEQAKEKDACPHMIEVLQQMQTVVKRIRRAKTILHLDIEKYMQLSHAFLNDHVDPDQST